MATSSQYFSMLHIRYVEASVFRDKEWLSGSDRFLHNPDDSANFEANRNKPFKNQPYAFFSKALSFLVALQMTESTARCSRPRLKLELENRNFCWRLKAFWIHTSKNMLLKTGVQPMSSHGHPMTSSDKNRRPIDPSIDRGFQFSSAGVWISGSCTARGKGWQ